MIFYDDHRAFFALSDDACITLERDPVEESLQNACVSQGIPTSGQMDIYDALIKTHIAPQAVPSKSARQTERGSMAIAQDFALGGGGILMGYIPSSMGRTVAAENASMQDKIDKNRFRLPRAEQILWLQSLFRSPGRIHFVVFQGISIAEDELIKFLDSAPFLTTLVVWEPVDSNGMNLPVITDKVIHRLVRHDVTCYPPKAISRNTDTPEYLAAVAPRNLSNPSPTTGNILPRLSYLELSGALTFNSAYFVDMLASRCRPSWHSTPVGMVPDVQLQTLCLNFRQELMDPSAYVDVHNLFMKEGRKVVVKEDEDWIGEVMQAPILIGRPNDRPVSNSAPPVSFTELSVEEHVIFEAIFDYQAYAASK
jgi:hypothetical protein